MKSLVLVKAMAARETESLNSEAVEDPPCCPYRNLLAEVLARAIRDYVLCNETQPIKRSAMEWLCIDKELPENDEPWSFTWVCAHLDLDPESIRDAIAQEVTSVRKGFKLFLVGYPNLRY